MRIAHAQIHVKPDAFDENLAKVVQYLERADRERAEIVCFPECCLTGYPDTEEVARRDAFAIDSPSMMRVLDATSRFEATAIVALNELRNRDLYNTAAVIHKGHLLGTFSKCSAYQKFHKQGREFPVFERGGIKFGVIICSDGGYIEPARILAVQGAKIIFAPHYNYIGKEGLIQHFMDVRADHTARAVENPFRRRRLRRQLRGGPAGRNHCPQPAASGRFPLYRHRSVPGKGQRLGTGPQPVELARIRRDSFSGDEEAALTA
jgi:predicted amidohydrolase